MRYKLFLLAVLTLTPSCQMMARMGAVATGAGTGALIGGPPGGMVGGVAALAAVEVVQAENETEEVKEDLDKAEEVIRQLTEGDVVGIINNQTKGLSATILDELMGWLKILAVIAIVGILGTVLYILKRKGYAKKYYEKIDALIEDADLDNR